ncbi:aminoglycoside 6-adenylyltransferase [Streptomyces lunaelactis]|uniref:aminoglycoside 6-adenylyltransferase n=1 Tax=Streptomyces lunaelactis TaxID=1535768 RepID=UPI0028162E47|nr:aminoglycoside 6-adenylyltransferase [Streptomyces lunaelactis]
MERDGHASPRLPAFGWQSRTLSELMELAAHDERIQEVRVHGSASGNGVGVDHWSDLDVMLIAEDPITTTEDFTRRIGNSLAPVFAVNRSSDQPRYCMRLVLSDLRRLDITATAAPARPALAPEMRLEVPEAGSAVVELINSFRFDAVLAAVKAARGDMLIGAHLTLQLARHVLVMAMLLRDREAGTNHHRYGGTRWDAWPERLTETPAPYTLTGILAAIRCHTSALEELSFEWDPRLCTTNRPLLHLLDAIEERSESPLAADCVARPKGTQQRLP